jgi:hypothetical protein
VGQQGADAGHFLSITERPIFGDAANAGQCPHQPSFETAEQGAQGFVPLLATGVTLFLVLADCAILKARQTGEQHIDSIARATENSAPEAVLAEFAPLSGAPVPLSAEVVVGWLGK